jgi:hypothetical protein
MPIQTTQSTLPITGQLPPNFKLVDSTIKRRMVMSIEGDWGTGKTDLALTAPGPIAFFKFDLNTEFTLKQFATKKKIYQLDYDIPDSNDPKAQLLAEQVMTTFRKDYDHAVRSTEIRTIVWDTATEIWEQTRLEAFGKLTNVMPHHYVAVNNGFRRLIRAAFDSDTNLIMIHRLKDEWQNYTDAKTGTEKGRRTGKKERAGFSDIGFACQVIVQTYFNPEDTDSPFQAKVLKCTQNPLITHRVYSQIGPLRTNAFPYLAADVFPGSNVEDWES